MVKFNSVYSQKAFTPSIVYLEYQPSNNLYPNYKVAGNDIDGYVPNGTDLILNLSPFMTVTSNYLFSWSQDSSFPEYIKLKFIQSSDGITP